jgi:hypothetical protein
MPNQGCEEARKFLDACETEAMLRAQTGKPAWFWEPVKG